MLGYNKLLVTTYKATLTASISQACTTIILACILYNLIIYEIPIVDMKSVKHDLHKHTIASVYTRYLH